ncbi:hypothetical protein [Streptosporangium sp. NBC_01469]|uniref:hypothetical protein n=1 Tax=Streptosporangium sp. NBC_01469 TaxID=2903898 RepID=UPI002E2BF49C|nr:hypothetical protein [Streptosporangium sp. NBC_01469]
MEVVPVVSTDVPSQPPVVAERPRPWRLQSQGYVAVLGGVAAVTAIALMNAARLDVPKRGRALIAGTGLLGLIVDVVLIWDTRVSSNTYAVSSVLLVLVVHVVQVDVQRPHDLGAPLLSRGKDHAPMWLAGTVAILGGGALHHLLMTTLAG